MANLHRSGLTPAANFQCRMPDAPATSAIRKKGLTPKHHGESKTPWILATQEIHALLLYGWPWPWPTYWMGAERVCR
jgi:hypothetical protein